MKQFVSALEDLITIATEAVDSDDYKKTDEAMMTLMAVNDEVINTLPDVIQEFSKLENAEAEKMLYSLSKSGKCPGLPELESSKTTHERASDLILSENLKKFIESHKKLIITAEDAKERAKLENLKSGDRLSKIKEAIEEKGT